VRSKGHLEREAAAVAIDGRPRILQVLGWSARDAAGVAVALSACILILVNTLLLQPGPHPAPMVRSSVAAITAPPASTTGMPTNPAAGSSRGAVPSASPAGIAPGAPRARSDEAALAKADAAKADAGKAVPGRPNASVVADIQRELARRGFYDGVVDGRYGPRTDASIREFEQAAGLRASSEPNEALLRSIQRSLVRSRPAARPPAPIPQARPDPIAEMIAPSKQIIAVQRALSEFGYGQIKPTGTLDPETQSAIQRFERERRLPVTGQLSHRVVRELAAITGRPLE
jgi:peptidoglycan hydrolase-like protein with peptidoglycan-binding domain